MVECRFQITKGKGPVPTEDLSISYHLLYRDDVVDTTPTGFETDLILVGAFVLSTS